MTKMLYTLDFGTERVPHKTLKLSTTHYIPNNKTQLKSN